MLHTKVGFGLLRGTLLGEDGAYAVVRDGVTMEVNLEYYLYCSLFHMVRSMLGFIFKLFHKMCICMLLHT